MSIKSYRRFCFDDVVVDGHRLLFRYSLRDGPVADCHFEEQLQLPESLPAPDAADPIQQRLLQGIHLALGVSYFKAAVPPLIEHPVLSQHDAAFWQRLYSEGMGEFWYSNDLDPRGRVFFQGNDKHVQALTRSLPAKPEKVLLMVGGGKDSAVAAEVVKAAGVEATAFSVGTSSWQQQSAAAMGFDSLIVKRRIDPALFALNKKGAYNGHIPISACIAFVSVLVAELGGFSAMIVANERSANEANTHWNGIDINHQWSKSLRFEQAFQQWCARQIEEAPQYFSVLRTMGELEIAQHFSRHAQYLSAFASCNANFRVAPDAENAAHWCGHCPKCVFVQLILKPFLDDASMHKAFGDNDFISAPANRDILSGLLGFNAIKPFECVGAQQECLAAITKLVVEKRVSEELQQWVAMHFSDSLQAAAKLWQQALAEGGEHAIPAQWLERLNAYRHA